MTNHIRLLLLSVIIILSVNLNAQKTLGIKGGINFSDFYDHPESEMVTGLKVGIFKDFDIGKKFIFSISMYYSEEGAIIEDILFTSGGFIDHAEKFKYSRGYIELPIYIGYHIKRNNFSLKPYGGLNLVLNSVTDNSELINISHIGLPSGGDYDLFDMGEKNRSEQRFGYIIGLEVSFKNQYIFDLNYNRFFDTVNGASTFTGLDYRTHYVNISIGLFIN